MVIVNMQIHRPDKMIIFLGLTVHSLSCLIWYFMIIIWYFLHDIKYGLEKYQSRLKIY